MSSICQRVSSGPDPHTLGDVLDKHALDVLVEGGSHIFLDCMHRVGVIEPDLLPSVFASLLSLQNLEGERDDTMQGMY